MNPTIAALKSRAGLLFRTLCASLGIVPIEFVIAHMSHACFLSAADAETFANLLRKAGVEPSVHHWDPKADPDFDRDEWQVSWEM